MRFLYSALLYLLMPLVLAHLAWLGLGQRGWWRRLPERFGFAPRRHRGAAAWVHAVSVGEVAAALPLVRRLLERHGDGAVLVTTTTPAGSERVLAALGDRVAHCYAPYDLPGAVNRFLDRVQPQRAIVMETELWPNLYAALGRRGVKLVIANARLSPRSIGRYRMVRGLAAPTLAHCAAIAAQSEEDAARFRELGADPARVHVLGNLKFDVELPEAQVAAGRALRARWGAARPVWVAASTHEGEEEAALRAHKILLARQRQAVLILVPRHPDRFDAAARLAEDSGLRTMRRSALGDHAVLEGVQVLVGDSMGELAMYFGAADIAFVGGSLVEVGGHNVLEPAALGLPVLFGPWMFNFEQARALLLERGAARQVDGSLELEPALSKLFHDAAARATMGEAGRSVLAANRGALARLTALIETL
ncbi:MAG: lipid IV(A) 3-deoxy-D-manno-octulosonic acid transferase [Gammaproteobacteria bacterium]